MDSCCVLSCSSKLNIVLANELHQKRPFHSMLNVSRNRLLIGMLGLLLLGPFHTFAQLDQSALEEHFPDTSRSFQERISLKLASHSFFRNNEFFQEMAQGYTLFGTMLQTELQYEAHPNLSVTGGLFLKKDFGNAGIQEVVPRFNIKYQKGKYAILFGNIEAQVGHRLIEPLLDYERFITHYNEMGLQVKKWSSRLWSDTWISWDRMQYKGSDYQERFTAGHSSSAKILANRRQSVHLLWQGMVTHRGGQLDIDTTPLQTLLNAAAGLKYQHTFYGIIREMKAEFYGVLFRDLSPTKTLSSTSGNGLMINAGLLSKWGIGLSLNYWQSQNYLSDKGAWFYQSASDETAKSPVYHQERELLFIRAFYQKKVLPGFYVDLRFEPFFDMKGQYLEYSYGLYFSYRHRFNLINLKKSQFKHPHEAG